MDGDGDLSARAEGITSAGGHGYTVPDGGSLATTGLDSNCNLGGGSIDDRVGAAGDKARAAALTHLFAVQFRLGLFDPLASAKNPFSNLNETDVATEDKQKLALEAAQQGIVLLKNTDKTLPLWPGVGEVAVLGPCMEVRAGGYSKGGSSGPYTGTATAAISNYSGTQVISVVGCGDPGTHMGKRKSSKIDCAEDPEGFASA